jgi:hypothetical protein
MPVAFPMPSKIPAKNWTETVTAPSVKITVQALEKNVVRAKG